MYLDVLLLLLTFYASGRFIASISFCFSFSPFSFPLLSLSPSACVFLLLSCADPGPGPPYRSLFTPKLPALFIASTEKFQSKTNVIKLQSFLAGEKMKQKHIQ